MLARVLFSIHSACISSFNTRPYNSFPPNSGSFSQTLYFPVQDFDVNITGVNTLHLSFPRDGVPTTGYNHNHVEFISTTTQQAMLIRKLKTSGSATDVKAVPLENDLRQKG